jgi:hypothetical protein
MVHFTLGLLETEEKFLVAVNSVCLGTGLVTLAK